MLRRSNGLSKAFETCEKARYIADPEYPDDLGPQPLTLLWGVIGCRLHKVGPILLLKSTPDPEKNFFFRNWTHFLLSIFHSAPSTHGLTRLDTDCLACLLARAHTAARNGWKAGIFCLIRSLKFFKVSRHTMQRHSRKAQPKKKTRDSMYGSVSSKYWFNVIYVSAIA